ncbi:MAG: peptidoglycan DD-metalloendopeptidase family protein, partial [Bacteroidales bacterium]|nr:peptidoglycan DD-metalloendopeptidase family protein [Bacteroidales bacterium]
PQTKRLSRAEYEKQQRDLQKQISATEKMISENDQSVLAQNRDIELRKDEIGKRRALLVSMQREIEAIRDEEDSLSQTIVSLGEEYKVKQEKFSKAVKHAFKWRSGYDEWMFVLSANDLMTGVRRMRYIREYTEWRKQEAFLLEQQRQQTDSVKQQLARTRADREKLRGALEKERQVLANKQRVQEEAVAKLQKRNRELKGELASAQKQQREIQKKIQQLIEEERKKAAEAASKSKKKTGGKKEPSSAYYTPSEVAQLTGSFKQNKGKMPYPLDANFAFLSHYSANGNYSINLSTAVGAHACAIFEGTVVRVARSSEDYTIILSHGDYMSVYSNLSAANVKEGQKVKMRQHIGTVKADIDNRRAQLMFWIYGKNDAENPELWLRK